MLKFALLMLLMLTVSSLYSQTNDGCFYNKAHGQITFKGDSIDYRINLGGCISVDFGGTSTYTIKHHRIFMKPQLSYGPQFKLNVGNITSVKNTIIIHVDDGRSAVTGANVSLFKKKQFLTSAISDMNGMATMKGEAVLTADFASVRFIGYKDVDFSLTGSDVYEISLFKGLSNQSQVYYATNNSKGYKIKIRSNSIKLKLPLATGCELVNTWVIFSRQP